MSEARTIRVAAPAKVNLWLDVLARRADGFHDLDTGLLALERGDVVEARVREQAGVALEVRGPAASADVPRDERNLALRAARAYLARVGATRGIELGVLKRIPSRAGLGAGSADAAAALLACETALGVALEERQARELLGELGSDCVFFRAAADTGFAQCVGRGEEVRPLPAPPEAWCVGVLVPDVGAPTADVYAALKGPLSPPAGVTTVRARLLQSDESVARGALVNRLEQAALTAVEGLARWRELLDEVGAAHFRLCGSGSAFFGLYREPQEAARCLSALAEHARARGLVPREFWTTRPARHGARLLDS